MILFPSTLAALPLPSLAGRLAYVPVRVLFGG